MILNIDSLDVSMKNVWGPLALELDKLGYNINVSANRKGATVLHKESGDKLAEVPFEMIEDEELNYILYSRLNLPRPL
jgi:hypothetical protein